MSMTQHRKCNRLIRLDGSSAWRKQIRTRAHGFFFVLAHVHIFHAKPRLDGSSAWRKQIRTRAHGFFFVLAHVHIFHAKPHFYFIFNLFFVSGTPHRPSPISRAPHHQVCAWVRAVRHRAWFLKGSSTRRMEHAGPCSPALHSVSDHQGILQSAPTPPAGSQQSCQPTVKLHISPLV